MWISNCTLTLLVCGFQTVLLHWCCVDFKLYFYTGVVWISNSSLTLSEKHEFKAFQNKIVRKTFANKRKGVTGCWLDKHHKRFCIHSCQRTWMEADHLRDLCLREYSYGYSDWLHLAQKRYERLKESCKYHKEYVEFCNFKYVRLIVYFLWNFHIFKIINMTLMGNNKVHLHCIQFCVHIEIWR